MQKLYKIKKQLDAMDETIPLIVKQKRFLQDLIENNIPFIRELAQKSKTEKHEIANEYFGYEVEKDNSELSEEKLARYSREFSTYLEESGLSIVWTLKDKPRELIDRVAYLSLKGLRKGFLQFMEMYGVINPSDLISRKVTGFEYPEKHFDAVKRRTLKTKIDICTIEEAINKELTKDPLVRKYLLFESYPEFFKEDCEKVAREISRHYVHKLQEAELKKIGII